MNGVQLSPNGTAMTTFAEPLTEVTTLSDLLESLGGIPPNRVLLKPPPGTATVQDVRDEGTRRDVRTVCAIHSPLASGRCSAK